MPLKLLADESLDFRLIRHLRESGYNVESVAETNPSIADQKVLSWAFEEEALLLTEDSDFGEWVFAHRHPQTGVVFLRYQPIDIDQIFTALVTVLQRYGAALKHKFVVITVKKIRIREV